MTRRPRAEVIAELKRQLERSLAEIDRTFAAADRHLTQLPPIKWEPLPPLEDKAATLIEALTIPEDAA